MPNSSSSTIGSDRFQGRGAPVISVDTKKKELVGVFAQGGRAMAAEWRPGARPRP